MSAGSLIFNGNWQKVRRESFSNSTTTPDEIGATLLIPLVTGDSLQIKKITIAVICNEMEMHKCLKNRSQSVLNWDT